MFFNVGGQEILVIAIVALIAVGPEQLPSVMRKVGRMASQLRGMASGMRDEFMSGMNEVTDLADPDSWLGSGADDDPIVPRGYADRQRDGKPMPSTSTGTANGRAAASDGEGSRTPHEASGASPITAASPATAAGEANEAGDAATGRQGGERDETDEDDEIQTVVTMPSGDLFTPDDHPSESDDAAGDPGETAGTNGSRA